MARADYTATLAAHRTRYRVAIAAAQQQGAAPFQAWFNREASQTPQQAMVRAFWDFSMHILTPTVCAHLARPEDCTALEIGYGGGRLLLAASRYFGRVVGVDMHASYHAAQAFLHRQQVHNATLLVTDGDSLPVASNSIDFVYSFIVLQHLPSVAVLHRYLQDTARCLRPNGIAQLYIGRFSRLHPVQQLWYYRRGYRTKARAAANRVSLAVRARYAARLARTVGLQLLDTGTSYYLVPDGYPQRRGGQHYLTLQKQPLTVV